MQSKHPSQASTSRKQRTSGETATAEATAKRRSSQAEKAEEAAARTSGGGGARSHDQPTLFTDATFPRSTLAALAPEHVTSLLYSLVLATTQSILAALAQCRFTSGTSEGSAQAEKRQTKQQPVTKQESAQAEKRRKCTSGGAARQGSNQQPGKQPHKRRSEEAHKRRRPRQIT